MSDLAAKAFVHISAAFITLVITYIAALVLRWWSYQFLMWLSQFFPDNDEDFEEPIDYSAKASLAASTLFYLVLSLGLGFAANELVQIFTETSVNMRYYLAAGFAVLILGRRWLFRPSERKR